MLRAGGVSFYVILSTFYGAATPPRSIRSTFTMENARLFKSFPLTWTWPSSIAARTSTLASLSLMPPDLKVTAPISIVRHAELAAAVVAGAACDFAAVPGLGVAKTLVEADLTLD